jgi:hypothetical protein
MEIGLYDILYGRKPSCLIAADGDAFTGESSRLKCFGKYCAIRKCARECDAGRQCACNLSCPCIAI